jgi:hypothetical protein
MALALAGKISGYWLIWLSRNVPLLAESWPGTASRDREKGQAISGIVPRLVDLPPLRLYYL